MYIRPFVFSSSPMLAASPSIDYKFLIICSPGAAYYSKPLSVYIEDEYSRAAPGGAGYAKAAGNYGSAFYPTSLAISKGFDLIIDGSQASLYTKPTIDLTDDVLYELRKTNQSTE